MGHFFRLCLKAIFSGPLWEKANGIAAAVICVIGALTYFVPRLSPDLKQYRVEDWQIIVSIFVGIILFRVIASPYWVYRSVAWYRDRFRDKLMKLKVYEQTMAELRELRKQMEESGDSMA